MAELGRGAPSHQAAWLQLLWAWGRHHGLSPRGSFLRKRRATEDLLGNLDSVALLFRGSSGSEPRLCSGLVRLSPFNVQVKGFASCPWVSVSAHTEMPGRPLGHLPSGF